VKVGDVDEGIFEAVDVGHLKVEHGAEVDVVRTFYINHGGTTGIEGMVGREMEDVTGRRLNPNGNEAIEAKGRRNGLGRIDSGSRRIRVIVK
jgi:hypothetical protein